MTVERDPSKSCRCKVLSVFLFSAIMSTSACAEPLPNTRAADAPMRDARSADAPAKLNLLAGGQSDQANRQRKTRIGNGSYLCTPAGFGQKSWCLAN